MPAPHPLAAAGIVELLCLQLHLDQPNLTLFDVRLYLADRLAALFPLDYHVYVRRWRGLAPGAEPGPLPGFLEWWPLVEELTESTALAEMIGAGDARVEELRRVLLVGEGGGGGVAGPGFGLALPAHTDAGAVAGSGPFLKCWGAPQLELRSTWMGCC
jgi:hypothetical protein